MNRAFYIKRNGIFVPDKCRMNPAFLGSWPKASGVVIPAASLDWYLNGDLTDASGNGLTGSGTGITYGNDDQSRATHAALFNGSTSKVDAPNNTVGNITSQDATMAEWLQWTGGTFTANPVIMSKGLFTVQGWYVALASTGAGTTAKVQVIFNQSSADQITESTSTALSESGGSSAWYHICIVRSGSSVKIYVNGADVTSVAPSMTNPATDTTHPFRIGMYSSGSSNKFTGAIAQATYWDSIALTAAQVLALYSAGSK